MFNGRPSGELRFVFQDGKKILQQRWMLPYIYTDTNGEPQVDYEYEWRNVPIVIETDEAS